MIQTSHAFDTESCSKGLQMHRFRCINMENSMASDSLNKKHTHRYGIRFLLVFRNKTKIKACNTLR